MTNVDFKNVSYNHVKGYCWSKEVNTDVILDVYEYHNIELNFSWEEMERTCMVCLDDCTVDEVMEDVSDDEDPIWSIQRDDHERLEEEE